MSYLLHLCIFAPVCSLGTIAAPLYGNCTADPNCKGFNFVSPFVGYRGHTFVCTHTSMCIAMYIVHNNAPCSVLSCPILIHVDVFSSILHGIL